jgi:hypothetical protein
MRLAIGLLALLAAGCGGQSSGDGDALVTYERGGGIAGVSERLVVDTGGTARLSVGDSDQAERRFALADQELERLRSDLEAADFAGIDVGSGLGCADCFDYEITYAGETTSFNEAAEVPDSVREVTGQLGQIVEAHLPERP